MWRELAPRLRAGAVAVDLSTIDPGTARRAADAVANAGATFLSMTNLAVFAEGYALARRAGIHADAVGAALTETGASSYQEEVHPWIAAGDHRPRFAVHLARVVKTLEGRHL